MISKTEKLNTLIDFLYNEEGLSPDDVKEALLEFGIDSDELIKDGLKFIKSLEKQMDKLNKIYMDDGKE